jgi:hypothetical protein
VSRDVRDLNVQSACARQYWCRPQFCASSTCGSSQNLASPSAQCTWTWRRDSSREKKKNLNPSSRKLVGLMDSLETQSGLPS